MYILNIVQKIKMKTNSPNIPKATIVNPVKAILIPRLYERKAYHSPKSYNQNDYIGNKRHYKNNSSSK